LQFGQLFRVQANKNSSKYLASPDALARVSALMSLTSQDLRVKSPNKQSTEENKAEMRLPDKAHGDNYGHHVLAVRTC
jgi:hypothetical protein